MVKITLPTRGVRKSQETSDLSLDKNSDLSQKKLHASARRSFGIKLDRTPYLSWTYLFDTCNFLSGSRQYQI